MINKHRRQIVNNMTMIFSSIDILKIIFLVTISLVISLTNIYSQPSGGPYGPVNKYYEIPPTDGIVIFVAPDGDEKLDGSSPDKATTIENAIAVAKTNDVLVLRGGIYRTGGLVLNQGIILEPYKNEKPILKGTFVADEWTDLKNGLWTTKWEHLFPQKPQDWWRRNRQGKHTPLHKFNNDMVFVDGKFLQSAGWEGEVDENSYFIDYETGTVYIGVDPSDKLIEITAFNSALVRTTKKVHGKVSDKKGYTLKGITITQYAYRALEVEGTEPEGVSDEEDHGKEVVGTTIENCSITFCSRVAGYFRGDNLTIKNCKISNTSTEGIYIIASNDVLLEKNIFTKNNIERITGYYPAAVKIFNQSHRVTCNDNLVIDLPYSNGIWYDVGNVDGVFTNNWLENVGKTDFIINENQLWPSNNAFFFEISKSAICAGNVFVNCDHAILVLNSSNVQIYNNTFINSIVAIGRDQRSAKGDHFGWHPRTGPDVNERFGHVFENNLLFGDESFTRPLFFVWQRAMLCDQLTEPQFKSLDYNVFVHQKLKNSRPMILWSPYANEDCQIRLNSNNELNELHPQFSANSSTFIDYNGPLFKSEILGDYRVLNRFDKIKSGKNLPEEISSLINRKLKSTYIGAYESIE